MPGNSPRSRLESQRFRLCRCRSGRGCRGSDLRHRRQGISWRDSLGNNAFTEVFRAREKQVRSVVSDSREERMARGKGSKAKCVVSVNRRFEITVPHWLWKLRPGDRVFFKLTGETVRISRRPIGLSSGRFVSSTVRRCLSSARRRIFAPAKKLGPEIRNRTTRL